MTCYRSIWNKSSGHDFLEFIHFCCWWIVYGWRRSIVTDGVCKCHTSISWRVFSVQKCAQNGNREKWRWIDTVWQRDENWDKKWKIHNSGDWTWLFVDRAWPGRHWQHLWWYCMTRTPLTSFMIAWHCTMQTPTTTSTDIHNVWARIVCAWCARIVSFSSCPQCHIICTRTMAQVMSFFTPSTWSSSTERFSTPWFFFSITCVSTRTFSFFLPAPEVRRQLVHSAQREYGLYWWVLPFQRHYI